MVVAEHWWRSKNPPEYPITESGVVEDSRGDLLGEKNLNYI